MSAALETAWREALAAALLGTVRQGAPTVPDTLRAALPARGPAEPEPALLDLAAAAGAARRAAWRPAPGSAPPPGAAPLDPRPIVGARAAGHLEQMLGGRFADALPEWLEGLSRTGRRPPPALVPGLLEHARARPALHAAALDACGPLGGWLAAQNPDWSFARAAAPDPIEAFETGALPERAAALRALRAADPAGARGRLEAGWAGEPPEARAALLGALETGLGPEDEPFLEAALSERRREIRLAAAARLALLPGSAFARRALERASAALEFVPPERKLLAKGKPARLEANPPETPSRADARDGVDGKGEADTGARSAWLVQAVSLVPPDAWTERFQAPPEALLEAALAGGWARGLLTGLARAASLFANSGWAAALLEAWLELPLVAVDAARLAGIAPLERALRALERAVRAADTPVVAAFVGKFPGAWSEAAGRAYLDAARATNASTIHRATRLSHLAPWVAARLPLALRAEARAWADAAPDGHPAWREPAALIADTLDFRAEALKALEENPS